MKNGKRLTRDQKIMLSAAGREPQDYLAVKNLPDSLILLNRRTGKTEVFNKR